MMVDPESLEIQQPDQTGFRSGFVALVGRPNVGKSTLLNSFLKSRLAITSDKPQTTRHRLVGIRTDADAQFMFLDTPGIHKPKEALNKFMVSQALGSMHDADVIVVVFSATEPIGKGDEFVMAQALEAEVPILAVLNKIDCLKPDPLLEVWQKFSAVTEAARDRIAISALRKSGTEALLNQIKTFLPEGPMYYPPDTLTDRSPRFLLAELVREQVIRATHEELPYATTVRIVSIEDEDAPLVKIQAVITAEQESQKAILIGAGGTMVRKIGTQARRRMEEMLHKQVFLDLRVEVSKNWRTNMRMLERLGYSEDQV